MNFILLDFASPTPIYAQLMDEIKRAIARGRWAPGDKIPSVREMAVRLRINPNTVARAYDLLVSEGVLRVQKGIGLFVQAPPSPRGRQLRERLERLVEDALAMGVPKRELHRMYLRAVRKVYP